MVTLAGVPGAARAQVDTSGLHATLGGWAESTWLLLLDRGAADGGRLNDRGMLQRFHPDIDKEYELDLISSRFGLSEEYVWHRADNGARYWGGSINHKDLVAGGNFKARVPLGRGWATHVRLDRDELPAIDRSLVRIGFRKDWLRGPFLFFEGTLLKIKPEMDLTVGGGVRGEEGEVWLSATMLEAFSDIIYQGLVVWHGFADTALDYEEQPFALRGSAEWRPARGVRVELNAAVLTPTRVRAYRQVAPDTGFRQDERFGFASGLFEWAPLPRLRVGGFATWVRAVTDRTPLPQSGPADDFRLVERTTRAGAFLLLSPGTRWRGEAWLARSTRPETRDYRQGAPPDVDYEDRAWSGAALVGYEPPGGFRTHLAFEWDLRDVSKGEGQVPSMERTLGEHNTRVRLDLGWQ
ncbi:MAG: hypothetical protein ACE5PT_14760, partial [Gemmatimonadales bacterium]